MPSTNRHVIHTLLGILLGTEDGIKSSWFEMEHSAALVALTTETNPPHHQHSLQVSQTCAPSSYFSCPLLSGWHALNLARTWDCWVIPSLPSTWVGESCILVVTWKDESNDGAATSDATVPPPRVSGQVTTASTKELVVQSISASLIRRRSALRARPS